MCVSVCVYAAYMCVRVCMECLPAHARVCYARRRPNLRVDGWLTGPRESWAVTAGVPGISMPGRGGSTGFVLHGEVCSNSSANSDLRVCEARMSLLYESLPGPRYLSDGASPGSAHSATTKVETRCSLEFHAPRHRCVACMDALWHVLVIHG